MIKVMFFSGDCRLYRLLSSTLALDFQLSREEDSKSAMQLLENEKYDAIIVDLNSQRDLFEGSSPFFHKLVDRKVPSIVLADDSLRSLATELVRRGAFAYCRNPPSVRELKSVLLRACVLVTIECPRSLQRDAATWRVNNSLLSRHPVQPNPAAPKESCRIQRSPAKIETARARPGEQLAKVRIAGYTIAAGRRALAMWPQKALGRNVSRLEA